MAPLCALNALHMHAVVQVEVSHTPCKYMYERFDETLNIKKGVSRNKIGGLVPP